METGIRGPTGLLVPLLVVWVSVKTTGGGLARPSNMEELKYALWDQTRRKPSNVMTTPVIQVRICSIYIVLLTMIYYTYNT